MSKVIVTALIAILLTSNAFAATMYKITGKLTNSSIADAVLLISKSGIKRATISGTKFSFTKLSASSLKNAKLYFFKDGEPVGPGALKESGSYKFFTLSGKAPSGQTNLKVTFAARAGYMKATKKLDAKWIAKTKVASSNFTGASLGYAGATGSAFKAQAVQSFDELDLNAESDADGVPDLLDIDDDNDGIPDDRDSGGGGMISALYLDFAHTINAHLGNLNPTSIANIFSSENVFSLTMFLGTSNLSGATGAHVECGASQVICRSSADGGSTSYYTGVSESNNSVRGQRWSDYNADGSGKPNLEPITFGGGGEVVMVGAVQPRSADFRAGDLITANVTNGSSILGTRVFTILPPSISSPMLHSYNVGAGTMVVDYAGGFPTGRNSGDPIVMTGNTITMNFYPPQRDAIPGVETDGAYRDLGHSKIGVLVGGAGISSEFTCAGLYSNLSTGLTEIPTSESMPGGEISSSAGAVLWPIEDLTPDTVTTDGALKSLTIDLAACLSRASITPGIYTITLTYAGASSQFGPSRAAQNIYISVPAVS